MKNIKLVIFDMEGTIFKKTYRYDFLKNAFPEKFSKLCETHGQEDMWKDNEFTSAWTFLCDILGPESYAKNKANWNKWDDGGYPGYSEWVIDTIKIHKQYGLTKSLFDDFVMKAPVYFNGVSETIHALQDRGISIAVISGGLKAMTDRISREFKIEHCYASAEYFWSSDGTIEHWNVMPTDFSHKRGLVELLHHDLGIERQECAFIGDGRNDKDIAKYVELSIGFNPKPNHRHWWSHIVEKNDLRGILEFI
ncbi:MAG: HAD-IB family phosphatase [Deltaproteobacteria bacterium]|nr:HAD-IB family phosphatase [Deltaproteobacteria bacterium]